MHRPTFSALCATTLALLAACQDHPTRPVGPPSALVSDGRELYGGNPDFFILPPLLPDPSSEPKFEAGKFNPELLPDVVICLVDTSTEECATDQPAGLPIIYTSTSGPGSETVRVVPEDEHYIVNIHVPDLDQLVPGERYRIQVFVASTRLGFADFIPESSMNEVKSVTTDEVIGLLDKRTLPFKFRIEDGAVCYPADTETCNSATIDLAVGGTVVLEGTGDRIFIPAQDDATGTITVTLQLCVGIDVDLPKFGNCLNVTADPPLSEVLTSEPPALSKPAIVSMCSILTDGTALPGAPQDDLITMYRQDNGNIFALPRADDTCDPASIGQQPTSLWQRFARAVGRLFAPAPLHATVAVLDVGEAGETTFFSDFQLVLSAQLNADNDTDGPASTDLGSHTPGSTVTATVVVTDVLGAPVANAIVRFTDTPPTEGAPGDVTGSAPQCEMVGSELHCKSGTDGTVAVQWTLSTTAGLNQLSARSIGAGLHADLGGAGPFDSCGELDLEGHCTGTATIGPINLTAGTVTFTAATETAPTGWINKASMPTPRYAFGTGVVNGILYAVGGFRGSCCLATLEAYDPASDSWTAKASMPTARYIFATAVVAGELYAVAGQSAANPNLGTVEAYNPAMDSWTTKTSLPAGMEGNGPAAGAVDGLVYVMGGFKSGAFSNAVAAYDPTTNAWTSKAAMPTARAYFGVSVVNGILYAIGGRGIGGAELTTVEAFDPATNTWTTKAEMPTARAGLRTAVVGGLIYAVASDAVTTTVEAYDPVTNTWTTKPSLPTPRGTPGVEAINGVLYVVGGAAGGGTFLSTNEAFHP